ncbi:MAG: ATP-binding protein [Bacteroidetes bacterium]|nr:ATP-binding protein [Bacteroidota bacterium]
MKSKPRLKTFHFNWKHFLVIFIVLLAFQIVISQLERNTLRELLSDTMDWYKQNSAEQIANLTTVSIEVLLESDPLGSSQNNNSKVKALVHALNSILKQPLMKRNVEAMCIILPHKDTFIAVDHGKDLYSYFFERTIHTASLVPSYQSVVEQYAQLHHSMMKTELITSIQEGESVFHVFVPLVPYGEYVGAVYLRIHPDVSSISQQIVSSFNKTVFIFSILILLGLLALFYLSTYTIMERDEAWELLAREREEHAREQIAQKKERLFTQRIYHTHHKAEKVMGFINEDIEKLAPSNIVELKHRIAKYANFIARVIYDMKWYNPPLSTMRGPFYNTNLNDVLRFIIENIFLRVSYPVGTIQFQYDLDDSLPPVNVNEFVIWEIVEPLIQNAIDHSGTDLVVITIQTRYNSTDRCGIVRIRDNGKGIRSDLLEKDENGTRKLFLEHITTKGEDRHSGYGCYLAYEVAKRCGWDLDAFNMDDGGCSFVLSIQYQ